VEEGHIAFHKKHHIISFWVDEDEDEDGDYGYVR